MKLDRTLKLLLFGTLIIAALSFPLSGGARIAEGPFNLIAWDSGKYVQLNWDLPSGSNIRSYNIYRSEKGGEQWARLNTNPVSTSSFVDYGAPRPELVSYRVTAVAENGEELPSASVVPVSTISHEFAVSPDEASTYSKNNILTDSLLLHTAAMTAAQIQSFLSSQGSVLANYSSGGKTAAQRIYDDCQTHGINPQVILATLQKEKGLIKSSTANPNSFAMGWNTGDSSTSDFGNQIYYGTRQFRRYYDSLGSYGWTVGQSHAVSDGTVTAANTATAGLYVYTPWIGQGGGGQTGIGGNYLFWDLYYNTFGFSSSTTTSSLTTSDGFDYPVSGSSYVTQAIDGDGWYNFQDFGANNHLGEDWNAESGGNTDCGLPVYAASKGTIVYAQNAGTGWRNVMIIRSQLPDGTQVETLYGHLSTFARTSGDVNRREQIGTIGDDGAGSPCHLHLEIRFPSCPFWGAPGPGYRSDRAGWTDPSNYIDAHRSMSSCSNGTSSLSNILGGPPIHPPGSVIKTASSQTVYLIDSDNRKRPITSASVLAQLYNQSTDARTGTNFSNWVITVTQDELNLYEQGGNLNAALPGNGKPFPDGKLISYNGEVSIVTGGGRRRPFTDGNRFTALGFSFCQVVPVSQSEYNSYPAGPPVDAMLMLTASVNLSPAGPYSAGQNITGGFTVRNVGYSSASLTSLGIGGRFNGSTVFDLNFVSQVLASGSSYAYGSQARQLNNAGTYDFFAAYQENNGHWAISVPAAPGVQRSRQIQVSSTPTPTPSPSPTVTPTPPSCTYSISSPDNEVGPGNGSSNLLMDTTSGCSWSAVSDATSWLTTSSSGTGDGTIRYDFIANPTTSSRTGTITVGGQVHTVTQIGIGGGGHVQFSSSSYSVNEEGTEVTITVTRQGGTHSGTVNYQTSDGTATAGSDYTSTSGLLLFGENQNSKTFTIPILDDSLFEGNESINLTLFNQGNSFTMGSPSTATLTITDNESSPTPTPTPDGTNFALASNGGIATASSTLDSGRSASAANNGDRKGLHWGTDPATGSGSLPSNSESSRIGMVNVLLFWFSPNSNSPLVDV